MSDHSYEGFVLIDGGKFDIGQSHGVCDLSFSKFDEVGNLAAFFYEQMEPDKARELVVELATVVMKAEDFHREVVAQLRAEDLNGGHADGEA